MNLVQIHECLCDRTRLRMMHLLLRGPLCVCHLQKILGEPQVKVSRHLAYLRRRHLVEVERRGQWMVYHLPDKRTPALEAQLACLQDCAGEEKIFRRDLERLAKLDRAAVAAACGSSSAVAPRPKKKVKL
jgi:ArsR family transcriptional regulator